MLPLIGHCSHLTACVNLCYCLLSVWYINQFIQRPGGHQSGLCHAF